MTQQEQPTTVPPTVPAAAPSAAEPDRHRNQVVSFRPSPELREVLENLSDSERRSMSQMLHILTEEALQARGLWPS